MSAHGPNFFIVGAMKAGTTSICKYIAQHPDIYISPIKEPNYYVWENLREPDALFVFGTNGRISARSAQTINTRDKYTALFSSTKRHIARGEGSTAYLAHPNAATRIHEQHAGAKIIAILRNPIERAYSAYAYNKAAHHEPKGRFRDAIESELAGERHNWFYSWRYLYCGNYTRQVTRYIETFGRTNVLLLRADDLKTNAPRACQEIFRHLNVRSDIKVRTTFVANRTTVTTSPIFRSILSTMHGKSHLKTMLKKTLPASTRYRIKSSTDGILSRFGKKPEPLSAPDRRFLTDYYEEEIRNLEQLTSWDLRNWRQQDR